MRKFTLIIIAICSLLSSCNTKRLAMKEYDDIKPNTEMTVPEQLAQAQLDAYNGHDLDAFLQPYAEDVKVYQFPNTLMFQGKDVMRERYQFVKTNQDLYCELVNRIVEGNTVIDHEKVRFSKDKPFMKAIAIYKIKNGKIVEVYFIQ